MKHGAQLDAIRMKIQALVPKQGVMELAIDDIVRDIVEYGDLCFNDGFDRAMEDEGYI